jgi:hypothetical protein
LLRGVVADLGRISRASFEHGELTAAIREAESLSREEAIPADYQKVFAKILTTDGTSMCAQREALAKLDLPLRSMTAYSIVESMKNSNVSALTDLVQTNRPLAIALSVRAQPHQGDGPGSASPDD